MTEYRKIEGFDKYEVNMDGKVRKIGNIQVLPTVQHRDVVSVNMVRDDGRKARVKLQKLVDIVWNEQLSGVVLEGMANYRIRCNGDIYSLNTNKLMKPTIATNGYKHIHIKLDDGTSVTKSVHRLIAKAFKEEYFEGAHVNHKDGNKLNNSIGNLEWVTNEVNLEHAWNTGLMKSKHKKCIISTNNIDWMEFDAMKDAGEYITTTLGIKPLVNGSKLGACAKKNASDKLNRGISNKDNPFRYRGYIIRYLEQDEIKQPNK